MTPEEKMAELGLELRPVPVASSGLLPWVQVGNLLYMSGRTPDRTDKRWDGQVGKEYTVAEGQGRRARSPGASSAPLRAGSANPAASSGW